MKLDNYQFKSILLPCISFAVIVLVAILVRQSSDWLLPILFLVLPFVDRVWQLPSIRRDKQSKVKWTFLVAATTVLLIQYPEYLAPFAFMVLVAAIPEEWFFRAYLQKRLGNSVAVVLIVSMMFSFIHFIAHDLNIALYVFIPSIFFGWIYKVTGDLVLVIMLHMLSNLVYYIYLESYILRFFGG